MAARKLVLVGGGGHCISCIDVIELESRYEIIGILDPRLSIQDTILGYPVLGDDSRIRFLAKEDVYFLITVGQIDNPHLKKKLFQSLLDNRVNIATVISPRAYIGKDCRIGNGSIIMHDAIIISKSSIGQNCIVNTKAILEHESFVGNTTHISTGAIINGATRVGDNCFVGSNATVGHHLTITDNVVIGASSLVIKSIYEPGVYISNNLRKLR